jgi:hypothetical protein
MDKKEFLDYLAIYGGDIAKWPEDLRERAEKSCAQSIELREALDEERRFEDSLMERSFEEPSPGLESGIISAAARLKQPEAEGTSLSGILSAIFSVIPLPKPAIALPILLVIGMAAGYFYANYTEQNTDSPQLTELVNYGEGYYE